MQTEGRINTEILTEESKKLYLGIISKLEIEENEAPLNSFAMADETC